MRKLLWFTLGFAAACLALTYLIPLRFCPPFAAGAVLLSLLFCLLCRKWSVARKMAAMALGFGFSCIWYWGYDAIYLTPAANLDGKILEAEIITTDDSYLNDYGTGVDGMLRLEGKTYQVRLFLEEGEPILPGTRLKGSFRFRMTTPDSADGITVHSGKGIFLLLYQNIHYLYNNQLTYIHYVLLSNYLQLIFD
jgi:hypothetical protein